MLWSQLKRLSDLRVFLSQKNDEQAMIFLKIMDNFPNKYCLGQWLTQWPSKIDHVLLYPSLLVAYIPELGEPSEKNTEGFEGMFIIHVR